MKRRGFLGALMAVAAAPAALVGAHPPPWKRDTAPALMFRKDGTWSRHQLSRPLKTYFGYYSRQPVFRLLPNSGSVHAGDYQGIYEEI